MPIRSKPACTISISTTIRSIEPPKSHKQTEYSRTGTRVKTANLAQVLLCYALFFEFSHFAPRTKQPETEAFLNSISGCFEGSFFTGPKNQESCCLRIMEVFINGIFRGIYFTKISFWYQLFFNHQFFL